MKKTAKWSFWALALVVLTLSFIPSTIWVETLRHYRRFVGGFDPGVLRPTKTHSLPHRGENLSSSDEAAGSARLEFVEFKLRAPKARQVYLVGEFNAWKDGTMPLLKSPGGLWAIAVPLPPGRYHYRYIVDGQGLVDPQNPKTDDVGGEKTSVKEVP